jgi:hypothetical protein
MSALGAVFGRDVRDTGRGRHVSGGRLAARIGTQRGDGIEQLEPVPDCGDAKLLQGLGLAAVLSSPVPLHRIDFSMPGSDSQRLNQLWLVTYINETGEEVVAQAKLANGSYAPFIAADQARLESMMPAARGLAKANNIKMRLIKFTNRVDIENIVP